MSALALPSGIKATLAERGITHAAVAQAVGVSRSAITQLINRGIWPARDAQALSLRLHAWAAQRRAGHLALQQGQRETLLAAGQAGRGNTLTDDIRTRPFTTATPSARRRRTCSR